MLQIKALSGRPAASWGDAVVVPVIKGNLGGGGKLFKSLNTTLKGGLADLIKLGDFTGKCDEVHVVYTKSKAIPARIILVGMGDAKSFTPEKGRRLGGRLAKKVQELKLRKITVGGVAEKSGVDVHTATGAIVEGLCLGSYRYDEWKTKDKRTLTLKSVGVVPEDSAPVKQHQEALNRIALVAVANHVARDLGNRPCNDLVPTTLAAAAKDICVQHGIKITVLDYKKAEAAGMHAFCAVARGSAEPPAFIVMEYNGGPKGQAPIVLVGKGLTFDTGGISLKPAENMDQMKFDMSGAGAVVGTMHGLGLLKLPINVVGIVPSVENMPGSRAYKPGDVIRTLGGPTIEVRNTDAEGRVVLADALAYAARYNPRVVIDLATLTGACVVALGHSAAALFSNDRDLARRITAAGEATGERTWELPLWDDYRDIVKSDVGDVRNSTGRPAGAITAACFLYAFAEKYRWAHLDIAGVANSDKAGPYSPAGATGFGVRLLLELLTSWPSGGK